ncbi:hypothetical protein Peur_023829 [Populus x canadensis]
MKSKSRNVALAMVAGGGGIRMGNISRSSRKKKKAKEGATERAWCCTSRENKTRRATKEAILSHGFLLKGNVEDQILQQPYYCLLPPAPTQIGQPPKAINNCPGGVK